MKFRHELKFNIDSAQAELIKSRVRTVCSPDKHGRRYTVRNLYFDDLAESAYADKQSGVINREKWRVRRYGDDTEFARIERKLRRGDMVRKQSERIGYAALTALSQGDFEPLSRAESPVALKLYELRVSRGMRAVLFSDYTREAYVYAPGNVRITFDSDLEARKIGGEPHAVFGPGGLIMEVKFDEFLPAVISGLISGEGLCRVAASKYTMSRGLLRRYGIHVG